MKKLRVLLLVHELSLTGAPKVILDAFQTMKEEIEVYTLSLCNGPLSEQFQSLGPLAIVPLRNLSTRGIRRLVGFLRHKRIQVPLKDWQPDIVYVNSVAALPLLKQLLLPNIPVLLHVHELSAMLRAYTHDVEHEFLQRPAHYIAVAEAVRQDLVQEFGIDAHKISVLHEFIPDHLIHSAQMQMKLRAPGGAKPFVVGGAGVPQLRKGITRWLDMAAELIALVGANNVQFVWVGIRDDVDGQMFRTIASKLGISENIEFVPVTPEPMPHYARFDVFAMTSWEDPCPIVVLEAMSLQKPVVCFAGSGGASEEVGDTGVVVPNFSAAGMAQAIADLMRTPERATTLGRCARERVLGEFTASVQTPKIIRIIQTLAETKA